MREGYTNRLLNAGVGGTFMKAFGTTFATTAGLASCHTRGAQASRWWGLHARPGGASEQRGSVWCPSGSGLGSGWRRRCAPEVVGGGAGAVFTSTSCTLSESLSESSSDEEDSSEEEAAAPPAAEKNRDIRPRLSPGSPSRCRRRSLAAFHGAEGGGKIRQRARKEISIYLSIYQAERDR